MLRRLAEYARRFPLDRAMREVLEQARERVAALPPEAPALARAEALGDLAESHLRLGELREAAVRFREVLDLLPRIEPSTRGGIAVTTVFLLGVTHLVMARQQLCRDEAVRNACILGQRVPVVPDPHALPYNADADAAMRLFADLAAHLPERAPIQVAARWLLNLAALLVGVDPAALPADVRLDPPVLRGGSAFPRFPEIAQAAGVATLGYAGSVILDDMDGDGLLDLMAGTLDPQGQLRVYRNRGDGAFDDVTERSGLLGLPGGLNLVQGDYDNDGDLDVLVLRGAWSRNAEAPPNSLLRNDGGLHFTDVTYEAGLADPAYPTQTAAWADYDRDGDLDLYVGNETFEGREAPGQLFRNEGDGSFTDVAAEAGVTNDAWAKSVVWGDYDGDGDFDLFVSNYFGPNRLYRNEGDGTFTDVAPGLGLRRPQASFVAWFWDVNNDGALDLLVNPYQKVTRPGDPPHVWYVAAARMGLPLPDDVELPRLYLGRPGGTFREAAAAFGLTLPTLPMGANFGDLDNDGWLDFYLGTGYPGYEGLMPNVMYHNVAGVRFEEVTLAGGFGHLQKGHGIAFADLDNDGDQDVFAQMGGMMPADAARDALFANPGFGNHWLKVRLVGTRSDRFGVGARLQVDVDEDGAPRSLVRWIGPGGSFGANPLRAEIGLGRAARVRRLQVRWPTSGIVQEFTDLAVDRAYVVQEEGGIRAVELPSFDLIEAARRRGGPRPQMSSGPLRRPGRRR